MLTTLNRVTQLLKQLALEYPLCTSVDMDE